MKAKLSKLKFNKYYIVNSRFSTKFYKTSKKKDLKQIIHNRLFEVDFDILENENSEDFVITININSFNINKGKRINGYDFQISARGFFTLTEKDEIEEDKQFQYMLYSALPMVISLCRSHLSSLTANGLFGVYTLPAVDLQALVNDWFDKENENKED